MMASKITDAPTHRMTAIDGAGDARTGARRAPVVNFSTAESVQIATTTILLTLSVLGSKLDTAAMTGICCVLILVLGMPHGALDITSLLSAEQSIRQRVLAFALYLAAGSIIAILWWSTPTVALGLFFLIAIAHFGEDWSDIGSPFLSHGAALGLLAVPTVLHGPEIGALFLIISGEGASTAIESILILIVPVAVACALVATAMLWRSGQKETAVAGFVALAGLLILPPIVGFALYFCLHHSPRHFVKNLGPDASATLEKWKIPIALATAAALGLAVIFYYLASLPSVSAALLRSCFMTLAVLTVPHMLLPRILALSPVSKI